ncbi:MAG: prepilin-type N-terminal cleavage/methylation domain-containing protein [Planctomycetota bacterium]|jgi:prepilin-type N-terminal cleavage/methylation domain-containing protein
MKLQYTKKTGGLAGFTLIELMIVVAIIAVIATIAVPKLLTSRVSANENAAIATLRNVATSQAQFLSSCSVDTNADGGGEYGYFGEMASVAPLRIYDPATDAPAIGVETHDPGILPTPFDRILVDGAGEGVAQRTGYYFKMFLPGPAAGGLISGIAENGTVNVGGGTVGSLPDSASNEILWGCYAWPVDNAKTGRRAFFINQEGNILQFLNQNGDYSGIHTPANMPSFGAAYSNETGGPDMNAPLGITSVISARGAAANDSNTWTMVGN